MRNVRFAHVLCLALCALGCDSNSDSDTNDTDSTDKDSRQLKSVPMKDLVSLCKAEEDRLEALVDPCAGAGLEETTKDGCESAHAACVQRNMGKVGDSFDCEGANVNDLMDCTATVSEFEACLKQIATFLKTLSCEHFGEDPKPPACFDTLSTKCPKLFAD